MTSLLATKGEAPPVLFSLPADVSERLTLDGRYTAERLFRDRPEIYESVVALLAEGRSIRAIKRACKVHHETIAAVAARENVAVDTLKERIARDLELAVQIGAERLVEVMDTIKAEQLPLALAIAIDKLQLVTGGATVRIETIGGERGDGMRTFGDWLQEMKRVKGVEMGLGGGENLQRGDAGAATETGGELVVDDAGGGAALADAHSTGLPSTDSAATGKATTNVAASDAGGAGGVAFAAGGETETTHSSPPNFAPKDASFSTP